MKSSSSFEYKDYSKDELMADGEVSYNKVCASCHQMNGAGIPGAFPGLLKDSMAVGDVNEHIDIVLQGKAGTAMASFANLNDYEIASIITYERNAWGNDTGDLVQPATIRDRK
jgi:cytochrome c oxidase subunit 2